MQNSERAPCSQLAERETAGLQQLRGYILRNLHEKLLRSVKWKSPEGKQIISLLTGVSQEAVPSSQGFVSCLNRGGLWSLCIAAQTLLMRSETHFK